MAAPTEISKAYEPKRVEEKWYAEWLAKGCFTANPSSPKPAYSIVIPPPNVTGVLTMGHVHNKTLQDILARRKRMPVYKAWRRVQMPIAFVVWYTVLAILYYLIVAPMALAMRLLGRDPLKRRLKLSHPSDWETHVAPQEAERYFRMY